MVSFFKRFEHSKKKPLNPVLRIDEPELKWSPRQPGKIAVCLNLDLFHSAIPDKWISRIIIAAGKKNPKNTLIWLSKYPEGYLPHRFAPNSWLGTTWDGLPSTENNIKRLRMSNEYNRDLIRFVSFEPLLAPPPRIVDEGDWLKWIIIGADSRKGAKKPPIEWAEQLIEDARVAKIAVYVKHNYEFYTEIEEYPHEN